MVLHGRNRDSLVFSIIPYARTRWMKKLVVRTLVTSITARDFGFFLDFCAPAGNSEERVSSNRGREDFSRAKDEEFAKIADFERENRKN